MRRLLLLVLASAVALAVLAAPAMASEGNSLGPPGGTFYAGNETFQTILTPTTLPDIGPFDTLYMFPDCATCVPVSDAAPGDVGYNGGRWKVVLAEGITSQLTNAEDVVAAADSLVVTQMRFVCPLIKA
jgi:hypothetical protein